VTSPAAIPSKGYIASLVANGLTAGCGGSFYCPSSSVTRQQMAVFLLKGKYGLCYTPPPCNGTRFTDVPCQGSPFDPWIEALAALEITGGCGGGNYCPTAPGAAAADGGLPPEGGVRRDLRPPACSNPFFDDVPCSSPFATWIYDLAARGITGGCSNVTYCPVDAVLRPADGGVPGEDVQPAALGRRTARELRPFRVRLRAC
jgi:hypothetical protein